MDESQKDKPHLASLVRGGDLQTEAEKAADFIYMAHDISNAYLVNTDEGDIMVNTGFMDPSNVARNQSLFAPHRTGPLRYIILTQAHPDHFGGVPAFKEKETRVIAHRRFKDTCQFFEELGPYFQKRTAKLWASVLQRGSNPPLPPKVYADIEVDRKYDFELGGRRFEVISTPGGESPCGLTVWMPNEKIIFTGNLFGPVFLSMPNLMTVRGDKPRLAEKYLESLDQVRNLNAELLITGHGEPIRGASQIRESLDKMYNAVSYIRSEVIAGMNAGKTVHQLMSEISLPDDLKIGEFHGKVSWAVKSIWEELSGWFYYDSTTSLYDVPRSSIDEDLVELAGGTDKLAERAQAKLEQGRPLEALHLLDIALAIEPDLASSKNTKKLALQVLLERSAGANLSETMWLRSEIDALE